MLYKSYIFNLFASSNTILINHTKHTNNQRAKKVWKMFVLKQEFDDGKDITIRGVNKELYNQFTEQRTKLGFSAGQAFSSIISLEFHRPWSLHGIRRPGGPMPHGSKPEIIRDLEKLSVSKKDLVSTGEKTMFLFRNIADLIFDEDVDGTTLVKHVKSISKSNVTFLGNVPKLIQLGLIRKHSKYIHPQDKVSLKDITIRNVSAKLYDEFISKAKSESKTTGEYFSQILDHLVPYGEIRNIITEFRAKEILVVKNEEKLTITKKDLEVLGERGVIFYDVENLVFSKDIDQKLFLKSILRIIKCCKVILPVKIPKLIVLSRVLRCNQTNLI